MRQTNDNQSIELGTTARVERSRSAHFAGDAGRRGGAIPVPSSGCGVRLCFGVGGENGQSAPSPLSSVVIVIIMATVQSAFGHGQQGPPH